MKIGRYLIVCVLMIGMLIAFGKRGLVDSFTMKEQLASLRETNNNISLENEELKKTIVLLKNDLQYIEMVARDELGMVKKGDLVYRYQVR